MTLPCDTRARIASVPARSRRRSSLLFADVRRNSARTHIPHAVDDDQPRIRTNDEQASSKEASVPEDLKPAPPPPVSPSLTDPVATVQWGGTLPSPRRAILGTAAGLSIALGGNLWGISSFLFGLDGGSAASKLKLDVLVPIKGYKRCVDYQNGYEFIYPASWLADQRLYRRYAERVERSRPLDPPPLRGSSARRPPRRDPAEPSAAFGPAGGTGEDNISVIVAPIRDGFRLENMGSPQEAAEQFLRNTVAPPTSSLVATLLAADARRDAEDGELYYTMEFVVEAPERFKRHNVAAYATRNGLLYTLNAQSAEARWTDERAEQFRRAAQTFRIISIGAGAAPYPRSL